MTQDNTSAPQPRPTQERKGYQPKLVTDGYKPSQQGGQQTTSGQGAPATPPTNPPNQGTGGKK